MSERNKASKEGGTKAAQMARLDPIRPRGFIRLSTALLSVLVCTACVAQDTPGTAQSVKPQTPAAEIDLTGAQLDKRKFLLGISMLGKSVEQDIELLRKMTGHTFQFKEDGLPLTNGSTRFRAIAPLSKNSPMLIGGGYSYTVAPDGTINSMSTDFVFNKKIECITVEDLESAYGRPTRIVSAAEAARKATGPSYVWNVIYDHPGGTRSVFFFGTALCSNDVVHSSIQKSGRLQ